MTTLGCSLMFLLAIVIIGAGILLVVDVNSPGFQKREIDCWKISYPVKETCIVDSWQFLQYWADDFYQDSCSALHLNLVLPNQTRVNLEAPRLLSNYSDWLVKNKTLDCWMPLQEQTSNDCKKIGISNSNVWLGSPPTDTSLDEEKRHAMIGLGCFLMVLGIIVGFGAVFINRLEKKEDDLLNRFA